MTRIHFNCNSYGTILADKSFYWVSCNFGRNAYRVRCISNYATPRAFQLIYSSKGGREEEKRDADGGVAAALGRARCGTYGQYTTGCGWEGWRCRNGQIP